MNGMKNLKALKSLDRRYAIAGLILLGILGLAFYPYVRARLEYALRPGDTVVAEPAGQVQDEPVGEPDRLVIASLGIEAPIVYVNEKNETVYQNALKNGVVHYPDTALPGQPGNVYIFGHSSDYVWSMGEYKTVFALLPQIDMGADIQVSNSQGEIFHYSVIETKVVGPRDLSVLDQFNREKSVLTLQTSYPLGTALQRYIVVAELQSSNLDGAQE
jgi:sortase A